MKKSILILFICFSSLSGMGQMGLGMPLTVGRGGVATTFNEQDMAIGINPSNLGWKQLGVSVSAITGGINMHSDHLDIQEIGRILLNRKKNFNQEDRETLAQIFQGENGLNFQSNIRWGAVSFQVPKLGGFGFSLESYTTGHISLNETAADIFFHGAGAEVFQDSSQSYPKASEALDGTTASYQSLRAFNINYGRKLFSIGGVGKLDVLDVYGGIGYRYIWGMGNLDLRADGDNFFARSAFSSNFTKIDYGQIQNFQIEQAENIFNAAGTGFSLDFGFSAILGNKVKAGISFINIGEVTWKTNVLAAQDTNLKYPTNQSHGATDYQFAENAQLFYGDEGVLNFKPDDSFTTELPAVFRLGAGIKVLPILELGADVVAPLNDADPSIDASQVSLAAQVNLGIAKVSTGYSLNRQYGESLPVGLQLNVGATQLLLGTGDILTFFNGESRPNLSLAFGMLRFSL